MKVDICEHTLITSKGFHVMMIGLETERRPRREMGSQNSSADRMTEVHTIEQTGEASNAALLRVGPK